jgi:D-alanyl-D-alanine dipeptidase
VEHRDEGEALVDLREAAPSVRIPKPQTIPYCRATVAAMAERVARRLPQGVRLAVTDAWRPLRRQRLIFDWLMECAREAFPDRPYAHLRRTVCRFSAPYDQKAPPGHCTGAALDVHLTGAQGEPLDVTSPYDRFFASATYSLGLTPEAARNRTLLVDAMLAEGFSNCRDEWWHYSYGDAGWAVRTGLDWCMYGLVELPEELYAEQQRVWEEEHRKRANPFLHGAP